MKQTNNAIKFLMAQYRAIFKNAYFKGIASAVLLTAGLAAAGSAQAKDYTSLTDINSGSGNTVEIDGTLGDTAKIEVESGDATLNKDIEFTVGSGDFMLIQASGAANDTVTMNGNGHNITINGSDAGKHFSFGRQSSDEKLQIKDLGSLTIQRGATVNFQAGSGSSGAGVDVYADQVTINDATVNVYQSYSGANANNAILRGKNIDITNDAVVTVGDLTKNNTDDKGRANLGWRDEATVDGNGVPSLLHGTGSIITITDNATLNLNGRVGKTDEYNTNGAQVWGKSLSTDNAFVNVSGAGAEIQTHENTFTNTNFYVYNGAQLKIKPYQFRIRNTTDSGNDETNVFSFINGSTTFDGGNFIVAGNVQAAGTLTINDNVTMSAGDANRVTDDTNGKANTLYNGVLTIGLGKEFVDDSNEKIIDTQSTLKISSGKLSEFLTESNNKIKYKDTASASEQDLQDQAGVLSFGAGKVTLSFTDTTQVDVHQFNWIKTDMSKSGASNTVTAGAIVFDESIAGKANTNYKGSNKGVTVYADDMRIAKTLGDGTGAEDITFEANKLTLGSEKGAIIGDEDWQGFDSNANILGVGKLIAHDELNVFDGKGNDYYLQNEVELSRDYYTKDESGNYTTTLNEVGLIKGDNLHIGNNSHSGSLTISGGAWKNDARQSLTISSGSLAVSAVAYDSNGDGDISDKDAQKDGIDYDGTNDRQYYLNGNPASLTWTGAFVLDGNGDADKATIEVTGAQGADATLDLRNASVTWGSGAVTLTGNAQNISRTDPEASAGEGILYITGNQFNSFLKTDSQTELNIGDDGVLYVDGPVTGDINFDKLTNAASNAADPAKVNFDSAATSGGTLYVNGGISLVRDDTSTAQTLDIGKGTIDAQTIAIHDRTIDADDRGNAERDKVTVAEGTLEVTSRLTSENATIEFGTGTSGASLVLDDDVNHIGGTVSSNLLFNNSTSKLSVEDGNWSLAADKDITLNNGASFNVGTSYYDIRGIKAALNADNLEITAGSTNSVLAGSTATFNTLQAGNGVTFDINGVLTVQGRTDIDTSSASTEPDSVQDSAETAGIDLAGATLRVSGANAKIELGEIATNKLVTIGTETTGSGDTATTNTKVTVNDALADATINLSSHGALRLNFAESTHINAEAAKQLKDQLLDSNSNGLLEVGKAQLDIKWEDETNLITSWDKVKDFVDVVPDVANDKLLNTLVNDVDLGTIVAGHFGAIETNFTSPTQLQIDGTLGLHNARNGGYFVFNSNNGTPAAIGVALANDSDLYLEGAGKIGAIVGTADTNSEVAFAAGNSGAATGPIEVLGQIKNIDSLDVGTDVVVSGSIVADYASVHGSLDNTGFDSTYENLHVWNGSELNTKNLTLTGANDQVPSYFNGSVNVADTLNVGSGANSTNLYVAGGQVTADKLVLANGSVVQVGWEAQASDNVDTKYFREDADYSGRMLVNTADLNGGSIVIDPEAGLETAVVGINKFAGASTVVGSMDLGSIDGSIFVGRNAVGALGVEDWNEFNRALSPYFANNRLHSFGSMFYLDGTTRLTSGDGIVMTSQSINDFTTYIADNTKLGSLNPQSHTLADTVYFGQNTALLVSAQAMEAAANNNGALVTFDGNGRLVADGGEILISGDIRADSYTLFTDSDGKVAVQDNQGALTTAENGITVTSENGFLVGTLYGEDGGKVNLEINKNGRAIMHGASDPVYASLVAYAQGYNGAKPTVEEETAHPVGGATPDSAYTQIAGVADSRLLYSYDDKGNKTYTYNNYFLQETISTGDGSAAETVARLGVFGGAAQAAIAAGSSTYDAVSGRMGVGANGSNITVADNAQGAALWLAPIYKTSDSDSFDAEGVDYGVDLNLYGVALGADYTLSNSMRFGAMFNVGSGDVDGQGAGSNVSNDFDYYGFAVYGGYTMGALSLVADVSYTVADNDLEGNTSIDKVGASLDSTNLSLGVTGAYQLDVGGMSITPHAGLRFSQIEIDDYTVEGAHDIAHYDADSMNIFSIPVGVTFAKEFQGEAWTVKPSFDVTLTGNFGDNETDGTVTWAGVENLATDVSSEVLDDFTYGATLGVAAKTGNFSLGLGVNYTGSSNVDEFGVQANARFVF